MRQALIVSLVLLSALYARLTYQQVNMGVFSTEENAREYLQEIESELSEEQQRYGFSFMVWRKGAYYAVSTKPISDERRLEQIWPLLEAIQPDAYVQVAHPEATPPVAKRPVLPKEPKADVSTPVVKEEPPKRESVKEEVKLAEKKVPLQERLDAYFDKHADEKVEEFMGLDAPERRQVQHDLEVKRAQEAAARKEAAKEAAARPQEPKASLIRGLDLIYWAVIAILLAFVIYQHLRLLHFNKRLHRSEAACQAGIKAKDEFLAKMSHEIRTPMHAIMGFGHLLQETRLTIRQSEYLDKIRSSADLLLNIINDILDFSKIEAGELNIEKVEFNINTILDNVSNLMHVKMYEKDIEFMYDIDNHVPSKMVGDPLRIEQVLTNLLGNAVKFTKEGEIAVKVKRIFDDTDDIIIEFAVSDTGIGLTSEQIDKLFTSYKQASTSTTREYGGTGLGLAISKQLVELMGGEIYVTSDYGHGSVFTFTIRAGSQKVVDKRQYRLPSKSLVNSDVLIVDKYLKSANALKQMLTYYHFKSDIVHAENEALYVLEDNKYDMIFIASEFAAIDRKHSVQKYKALSDAKIILIESSQELISTFMNKQLPVDGILYKPFTQQDLIDMFYEVYSDLQEKTHRVYTREDLTMLKGSKILLAEDNQINQKIIFGLFEGSGIDITVAWNGQEAIDQLEQDPSFDLVLMDINMPVMGGYEASERILKHDGLRHIPIIALTANALNADVQKIKEAGMRMSLSKPLDVEKLYETLFEYIQPKAQPEGAASEGEPGDIRDELKSMFKLSNLNARDGLEMAKGDIDLYRGVLSEFSKLYYDSVSKFERFIDERKWQEARKLAHAIYELSETIGAYSLAEILKSFQEELSKEEEGEYTPLLQEYNKELVGVVYSIEFIL